MARIGLLSDSHGQVAITHTAVQLLIGHGAQLLLHLGDVETELVIDALVAQAPGTQQQIEVRLVFGNTDFDIPALSRYARALGITVDHPAGRLRLPPAEDRDEHGGQDRGEGGGQVGGEDVGGGDGGGELVFCHGHQSRPMREALREGVRYLCHGHTHQAADTRHGATRIINPGALYRARQHTVALLCTQSDTVTFYPVS